MTLTGQGVNDLSTHETPGQRPSGLSGPIEVQLLRRASARGWEDGELYRGGRLEAANEWASTHRGELAITEAELLEASDERRRAEEEAETRQLSRLRRLLGAVAVAAAIALTSARRPSSNAVAPTNEPPMPSSRPS